MKRTAVRWLGAGFAVALAGLGVAPPALAQEPTTVNAVVDDATVAVGGTGRTLNVVISVAPGAAVNDLHLTLSVPDFVQLTVETGFFTCTAEAGTTECQWSGGFPISGVAGYPGFTLAAGPLAVAGQTGELSVTTSGSDVIGATHTSKVTVGEGVDLVASLGPELTSAPGGQLTGTFVVGNAGASPVFGAVLRVFEPYALPPTQRHSNCMYRGDDVVSCGFDTVLEPGKAYRAEMAFEVRTDTQAPSNQAVQNLWLTPADWADSAAALVRDGGSLGTPGTGPALALVETTAAGGAAPAAATLPQTDVTPEDAFSFFEVAITGNNQADLAAIGATRTAQRGTIVDITVGVRNLGPASLIGDAGVTNIRVGIPTGSQATGVPGDCFPVDRGEILFDRAGEPGHGSYLCQVGGFGLRVGTSDLRTFTLRVDRPGWGSVVLNADNRLVVYEQELNPANNRANILISPTGTGG